MNRCIVLIGPPCSGKSSIGKPLARDIGYTYISSGDIARKMAEEDGTIGNLNAGKMAPEDRMREEIANILRSDKDIILDGFPRFTEQYEWMINKFFSRKFLFILVDVPTLSLFMRAARRGRKDDAAFMERLEYYMRNTVPMLNKINADYAIHGGVCDVMNTILSRAINEIKEYLYENSWVR